MNKSKIIITIILLLSFLDLSGDEQYPGPSADFYIKNDLNNNILVTIGYGSKNSSIETNLINSGENDLVREDDFGYDLLNSEICIYDVQTNFIFRITNTEETFILTEEVYGNYHPYINEFGCRESDKLLAKQIFFLSITQSLLTNITLGTTNE